MNEDDGNRAAMPPARWPHGLLAIVAGIALLTAACSGSPSAGGSGGSSAPGGSSSSPAGSSPSPSSRGSSQLAYSKCMGAHGVPGVPTSFPTDLPSPSSSSGPHWKAVQGNGPDPGSPQWLAAQQACQSLIGRPTRVPG